MKNEKKIERGKVRDPFALDSPNYISLRDTTIFLSPFQMYSSPSIKAERELAGSANKQPSMGRA